MKFHILWANYAFWGMVKSRRVKGMQEKEKVESWGAWEGKESLHRSLMNFHFHPGNPGTPQSVKTVTANVQIRRLQLSVKLR